MRERKIENRLVSRIKEIGGIAYKFSSPNRRSVPDRLCVLPDLIFFVECKATGEGPTRAQIREMTRLSRLGHTCWTVNSYGQVEKVILWARLTIKKRRKDHERIGGRGHDYEPGFECT